MEKTTYGSLDAASYSALSLSFCRASSSALRRAFSRCFLLRCAEASSRFARFA